MPPNDERAGSSFWAFWRSLPGILTGVAGVIAAVATLAALFVGDDRAESPPPGSAGATDQTAATGIADPACLGEYFKGIARDRVGTVEAGARAYDVIEENQPKAGTIGMTFTNNARTIGAIRFALFPANALFKIESIVDARCRRIEDYENLEGGDKNAWQDSSTVRLRLGGRLYDLNANGRGSVIRISFLSVVP
jgi:hypothetical protein